MCQPVNFDELHIWKEARELVKEVYYHSKNINNHSFNDSFRRTALAVLSNIAEGYGSGSRQVLKVFLFEANGCCQEICNLLGVARYHEYLDEAAIEKLMRSCEAMIVGIHNVLGNMSIGDGREDGNAELR